MLKGINFKDVAADMARRSHWLGTYVGDVEEFLAKQDWRFRRGVWLMTPEPINTPDNELIFPNIIWSQNKGIIRQDGYLHVKNIELMENGIKFIFSDYQTIEYIVHGDGTVGMNDKRGW